MAGEKGSSNWMAVIPLKRQGFALNRTQFTDAINLRYHRELKGLPSVCACSHKYNITHALNCSRGGFIHMRHDNIRDFLAGLLKKTQTDVQTEPPLQPLRTGQIQSDIGNTADGARLDIRAKGFWRPAQDAFFDIRVTNPLSASHMKVPLSKVYDSNEKEKKRNYNHRVQTVELGTFTPLVFSTAGSMGPECSVFMKNLAQKIAEKEKETYNNVIGWIRAKLSFLCLKASISCLRGTRHGPRDTYISQDFSNDILEAGLS